MRSGLGCMRYFFSKSYAPRIYSVLLHRLDVWLRHEIPSASSAIADNMHQSFPLLHHPVPCSPRSRGVGLIDGLVRACACLFHSADPVKVQDVEAEAQSSTTALALEKLA